MQEKEKNEIIQRTADEVMRRLQGGGLQPWPQGTGKERAEAALRQYPEYKRSGTAADKTALAVVDEFLTEFAQDPYIEAVRLFYFSGLTNAQVAEKLYCDDTTCRRNRSRLVRLLAARLENR